MAAALHRAVGTRKPQLLDSAELQANGTVRSLDRVDLLDPELTCVPAFIHQTDTMRPSFFVAVRFATVLGTALSAWIVSAVGAIVDYPSAVQALNPTHYYRLDETAMGAVADTGTAPIPAQHEGLFPPAEIGTTGPAVPGFDANNRALFDNDAGGVRLGPGSSFAADIMSVAMWFQAPGGVQIGDRLFTNNIVRLNGGTENSFQMVMPNGSSGWSMAFATGNEDPQTPEDDATGGSERRSQCPGWPVASCGGGA